MATSQVSNAIQQLHRAMLVQEAADAKLLESFVTRREAAALEALVRRHGPMVWNVCRRVLRNPQDAEDAFQATFLVFVRKAASIVPRELVGNWLYGVAHQTALKANATTAKRRTREKQVTQMPEPAMTEHEHWTDLQPILDQEISRLADHYRVVIVLCDLEGKTRSQAAEQLGWPEGTVAGRLARARTTLAKRLVQRGIVLSAGALAAVLSQQAASACVPGAVMATTLQTTTLVASGHAATAAIPAKVAALTERVVKAMLLAKLKTGACALLMVGMVTLACGMLAFGMTNAKGDDPAKPALKASEPPKDGVVDKDNTLTVTIEPQKNRIRADEPFNVDVRVVNSSKSPQSIRVMSGSWRAHWKSSNERISWEPAIIGKDVEQTVILEPGKGYEKTGAMFLVAGKPQQQVSFKMGFTPIGSKQTFWSNEVTVQVEGYRFVPIASYPTKDRAAEKRIRELLDAAKVTFASGSSLGVTVSVADDKAKQARDILEKAVLNGTLSVTLLEQFAVPTKLRAVRTDDMFRIEEDAASNEEVTVAIGAGLLRTTDCDVSVYRGKERLSHIVGNHRPAPYLEFKRADSKFPQPGESYEVELVVRWFETDVPIQPNWKPKSGGKYKVLVTRTLKVSVGPENTKPAPVPQDKLALPRGNAALPELVKKCKGAVVATLQEVGAPEVGPPGAADYASKWKVEKVLRGAYPETAHLSFRVQSVPIERRERPPAVGKTYILITHEANANQVATILDANEKNLRKVQDLLAAPPNRWEKLLQDKNLTAKQRKAYEQIAKLHSIQIDDNGWGSISIPSFVKDSQLPTDVLYAMGLDALPMLVEALDDETPTATVITSREGDFKLVKVWKVNDFAALLIVRIADRDFVIGELPKELSIRDISQRPKAASEFRKLVVAWHGKFARKTHTERKIADISDPWFRNRFDAIISLGSGKVKEARTPIAAHVDAFYADKNREFSSLTREEMSQCALALGKIGDKADLPQMRKVCKDMSHWLKTYGVQDSGMLADLFRSYQGLALLGAKDEALTEFVMP